MTEQNSKHVMCEVCEVEMVLPTLVTDLSIWSVETDLRQHFDNVSGSHGAVTTGPEYFF